MYKNEHIESLGYRIEATTDVAIVGPLLRACGLSAVEDSGRDVSEYLMATTRAGGLAACAGWTRVEDCVVLHSLAVAPSSRGSGVGAALMAMAMATVMGSAPVEAIYLMATGARRFFASYGFTSTDAVDLPACVREHETFSAAPRGAVPMTRHYLLGPRGLDQCAFYLVENNTPSAVLPAGAIVFFRQTGQMIEASYRGGPVARGNLLGRVDGDQITYLWHAYATNDELLHGVGNMAITRLPDGRRELRELSGESSLVMREA